MQKTFPKPQKYPFAFLFRNETNHIFVQSIKHQNNV